MPLKFFFALQRQLLLAFVSLVWRVCVKWIYIHRHRIDDSYLSVLMYLITVSSNVLIFANNLWQSKYVYDTWKTATALPVPCGTTALRIKKKERLKHMGDLYRFACIYYSSFSLPHAMTNGFSLCTKINVRFGRTGDSTHAHTSTHVSLCSTESEFKWRNIWNYTA